MTEDPKTPIKATTREVQQWILEGQVKEASKAIEVAKNHKMDIDKDFSNLINAMAIHRDELQAELQKLNNIKSPGFSESVDKQIKERT